MDKYYVNSRDSERIEQRLPKYGALFFVCFSLVSAIITVIIKFFLATLQPWDIVLDASISISTCIFTLIIVSFFIFYGVRMYKLLRKYSLLKRRQTLKGKKVIFFNLIFKLIFSDSRHCDWFYDLFLFESFYRNFWSWLHANVRCSCKKVAKHAYFRCNYISTFAGSQSCCAYAIYSKTNNNKAIRVNRIKIRTSFTKKHSSIKIFKQKNISS